jgi:hypothetical protein
MAGNGRFRGIPEVSWKQYSSERIQRPDLSGFARNRQEPVETGSRIRSPDSFVELLALPGGFRLETGSFLKVFAGNSRNTASGIIDLGLYVGHISALNIFRIIFFDLKVILF